MRKIIALIIISVFGISAYAQTPIPGHAGSISEGEGGAQLLGIQEKVVAGDYAYMVGQRSGLEIVDISNPTDPIYIYGGVIDNGNIPTAIDVLGNYAYVGREDAFGADFLEILDISNPAAPVQLGSIIHGDGGAQLNSTRTVVVSGNYAYITGQEGLEIVDISNPVAPVHVGYSAWIGYDAIALSGNYAYITDINNNALHVMDISNPAAPVQTGTLTNLQGGAKLASPRSVAVSGDYAYVVGGDNALEVVNVSNPTAPLHTGSITDGQGGAKLAGPVSVAISGSYAYVMSAGSAAMQIVDISNPFALLLAGSISNVQGGVSVDVLANYVYAAATDFNEIGSLSIIDISNSAAPILAGKIETGDGGPQLDLGVSVVVSGDYAYVASFGSDALSIVDVSNPATPIHAGSIVDGQGGALLISPRSVFVLGNYAYVVGEGNALEIVDISNPTAPVHVGSIIDGQGGALLNLPNSVVVSGNYAYVASAGSGALEIVDISNPAAPTHTGSITNGQGGAILSGVQSVVVSGNYAYLACGTSNALEIVDITNPASPVHAGSITNGQGGALLDKANSVSVSGNYAYVASYDSKALEIVDVSNPAAPVHAGSIIDGEGGALLNGTQTVVVLGNYAYVTSEVSLALEIVDISNPTAPVHASSVAHNQDGALLDGARAVDVSGNYAYVTSGYSYNPTLEIVAIFTPPTAVAISPSAITTTSFNANCEFLTTATSGYFLDVSTDNFSTFVSGYENLAGAQTISVSGLNPGTTYQYRFRAANPNGASGNSNIITVVTTPAAPVASAATNVGITSFIANWEAVTGVDSYYLEVVTDPEFSSPVSGYDGTIPILGTVNNEVINGLSSGTTYYYRVTAENVSGKGQVSNEISILTVPSEPAAIDATNIDANSFTANWEEAFGADGYYLEVSTDVTFSTYVTGFDGSIPIVGFSQDVTGLTPTTTYYYRLIAENSSGLSLASNVITTATTPPAPVALNATNVTTDSFTANWEIVPGVDRYYLELATDASFSGYVNEFNGTTSIDGAVTSQDITGLTAGIEYFYRVTSEIATSRSVPSNVISQFTASGSIVIQPVTNVSESAFTINWETLTGVSNYFITISTNADLTNPLSAYDGTTALDASQTSENVTGLSSGTVYYYQIVATTSGGSDAISSIETQLTYPSAPTANAASEVSASSFIANWSPVTGVDNYYLQVSVNNNFSSFIAGYDGTVALASTITTEAVSGLGAGSTYFYRVIAENTTGQSDPSNSITVGTLLNSPIATNATSIGDVSFVANWEVVTGANEYELEISIDEFSTFIEGYNPKIIATTQELVEELIPETTYSYRVRAKNSNGVSDNSNIITATTLEVGTGNTTLDLANISYSNTQDNATTQTLNIAVSGGRVPYAVVFRYKGILETSFTEEVLVATSLGNYTVAISPDILDELGLEFEVGVADAADQTDLQKGVINLAFNETQSPTLPFDKFGGTDISWNLFTIPYDLVDKSVNSIFANYDPARHEFDWKISRYRTNSNDYVNFNTGQVKLGEAYWFNAKENLPIQIGAGKTTDQLPFPLSLGQGWNLIGNPYTVSISWNQVLADNASISGVGNLQVFTGSQQATGDVMAPFSGGFVWSDAATTVRINPLTSKTGGRIGSSGGRVSNDDIDAAAWMIPLSLSSNIEVDVLGGIGMHPEASLSKDKFDEMGVPRFMVYNDLYTRHEDYFYPKFATDIVPTGASHTWSFTLSSNKNQELTELVWDNEVLNDRLSKLYLLDLSRGVVIDMNAQNSYAVNLSHGDFKFEIQFVTDGEAFLPHHLIMGNAFPNPAISMVTIPVIIPQEAGDHYMTLKVYDMNGKEITTLAEGVFAPGGHMFNWNIGQQEKNDINGLYFYRLTFDNDQFTPIQKKIIIQR